MKKRIFSIYLMTFLIIIIILAFITIITYLSITYTSQNILFSDDLVVNVIDGDTFELYNGETVRLICVQTPEINQEGYEEAKAFLSSLILNKEVRLESDVEDRDQYNRLLRYVYITQDNEELFVNREIVQNNLGALFPYGNSTKRCNEIAS